MLAASYRFDRANPSLGVFDLQHDGAEAYFTCIDLQALSVCSGCRAFIQQAAGELRTVTAQDKHTPLRIMQYCRLPPGIDGGCDWGKAADSLIGEYPRFGLARNASIPAQPEPPSNACKRKDRDQRTQKLQQGG